MINYQDWRSFEFLFFLISVKYEFENFASAWDEKYLKNLVRRDRSSEGHTFFRFSSFIRFRSVTLSERRLPFCLSFGILRRFRFNRADRFTGYMAYRKGLKRVFFGNIGLDPKIICPVCCNRGFTLSHWIRDKIMSHIGVSQIGLWCDWNIFLRIEGTLSHRHLLRQCIARKLRRCDEATLRRPARVSRGFNFGVTDAIAGSTAK